VCDVPRGAEVRSAGLRHLRRAIVRSAQVRLGARVVAALEQRAGEGQRQLGVGVHAVTRHPGEHRRERAHLPADEQA
jgi:hypothetical protein